MVSGAKIPSVRLSGPSHRARVPSGIRINTRKYKSSSFVFPQDFLRPDMATYAKRNIYFWRNKVMVLSRTCCGPAVQLSGGGAVPAGKI